jgi:KDO2-lipid IV(A) lauroyltransferase
MYYLFLIGKFLSLTFPREFCYFVAKIIASLYFYFSKKDREVLNYNLSLIVKDKKKLKKCIREVFINFSYYLVDFFWYSKLNKEFIKKYVKITGLEHIEEALKRKKGVIAITAHLGNYELGGAITSLLGYPLYAVALPHKDKRVDNFFNSQRKRVGLKIIPTGGATIKRCISVLRKGEILALLGDRDFSRSGIKIEMFSSYAFLPKGVAFFSLKTKSTVIPSFLIREEKKFYHLIFEKPIFSQDEDLKEKDIIEKYAKVLEKYLEKYPQQWYMFEKYWIQR